MSTKAVLIRPDGTVIATESLAEAERSRLEMVGSSVVMLRSPLARHFGGDPVPYVGWVDEYGEVKQLPVNRKAWALYGRSPIYGTMVVRNDLHTNLQPGFINTITKPIEDWVDVDVLVRMEEILEGTP